MKLKFELTNEQRKYLGLIPVEEHWELIKFDNNVYYYFEDDIIKKEITVSKNYYHEAELNEKTAENRTMILPKIARGKIKKFNYTATQSFSPFGNYFTFSTDGVIIANYTTQRTYYSERFSEKNISLDNLKNWLDKWIKECTEEDLKELSECLALPSQAIMDNIFYYGEAIILGNISLEDHEYDMLISVSESISYIDKDIAYLQYGLIYREIPLSDYQKLIKELKIDAQTLRREGIGFVIDTYKLKECIEAKSNSPFWEKYKKRNVPDLKNPAHIELKRKVFKAFGLDTDKTYKENLEE